MEDVVRIFLSGPMGSGKSTVAAKVAARLGVIAYDLDAEVERATGRSVAEIFERQGEARFRQQEADVLRGLLARDEASVIALGGGTVTNQALRRELLGRGTLITLRAPVEVLARRVGSGGGRPLLAGGDVTRALAALLDARAAAYAECHGVVDASDAPDIIAERAVALAQAAPIVVPLGERSYRVDVGAGIRGDLAARVGAPSGSPLIVVTDTNLRSAWTDEIEAALDRQGHRLVSVTLEPGEPSKTLRSVETIWRSALDGGADRASTLIGIGGGVVGDLSGFAGSTLLRGVRVAHVATSVVAMVDSAIGGKTGFDVPQGKNLIGTFHQPAFVMCDVDMLDTLPVEERRAGLAEVVKSAWIAGEEAVAMLEADASALAAGEREATTRAVRMAAGLKAQVVADDEREAGRRALLNFGHTLGHALEAAAGYGGLRHGEAVALGMVAAMSIARQLGRASRDDAERLRRLLVALGLPVGLDGRIDDRVLSFLGTDKKRRGRLLAYIVPGPPGSVEPVSMPLSEAQDLLRAGG